MLSRFRRPWARFSGVSATSTRRQLAPTPIFFSAKARPGTVVDDDDAVSANVGLAGRFDPHRRISTKASTNPMPTSHVL